MCVIMVTLGSAIPHTDDLQDACWANPDGCGWAVVTDSGMTTARRMDASKAIMGYTQTLAHYGERVRYSIFHARIATHGTKSVENCHPFVIGDSDAVLFHNGIMSECHLPGDKRSDTAIMAAHWLPPILPVIENTYIQSILGSFAFGSKLVIAGPAYDVPVIINEDDGIWEGDTWYSNTYFRYEIYTKYDDDAWKYTTAKLNQCHWCEQPFPPGQNWCFVCKACQECGSIMEVIEGDKRPVCMTCEWCGKCGDWGAWCACDDAVAPNIFTATRAANRVARATSNAASHMKQLVKLASGDDQ